MGALEAGKDLSAALRSGRFHYLVEADIRSFFDNIDHEKLIELLELRRDDKPFLKLIRKWLKAGILEPIFDASKNGQSPVALHLSDGRVLTGIRTSGYIYAREFSILAFLH